VKTNLLVLLLAYASVVLFPHNIIKLLITQYCLTVRRIIDYQKHIYGHSHCNIVSKDRDTMISNNQSDISQKIIGHLRSKSIIKEDDLNGICLSIFEKEINNLSDKMFKDFSNTIIKELSELIDKGIIKEHKDQNEKLFYRLANSNKY
jgi:hypothetical protein